MPQKFYFIGICGVAMATLAIMLKQKGYLVSGSDEGASPPMSDYLQGCGVAIFTSYHTKNLAPKPDAVIIGNSQSRGNCEVEFVLEHKIPYFSMAETIKNYFLQNNFPLVVSGTHGKTTVSALISYLLIKLEEKIGFFIGAASSHFDFFGRSCPTDGQFFVIEGDEYDTSFFDKKSKFFHYFPHYLVINNIEFDHIDIFQNEAEIIQNFHFLTRQVPPNGAIFANYDSEGVRKAVQKVHTNLIWFGQDKNADYVIEKVVFSPAKKASFFTLSHKNRQQKIQTPLLGLMNVYNTTAAILCCLQLGHPLAQIQKHLLNFQNAKRRLEIKTNQQECIVYDDFAHHPTAITQTIASIRQFYPHYTIFAIYEPRSNTAIHKFYEPILHQSFLAADRVLFFKNQKLEKFNPSQRLNLDTVCQKLAKKGKKPLQFTQQTELADFLKKCLAQKTIFLFLAQSFLAGVPQKIAKLADEKYQ